jgi:hypothetical protein
MSPDRWEQIQELYDAALELEPAQQSAFLKGACGDDEALCREVEALLAAHGKAVGFLETPALGLAAQVKELIGSPVSALTAQAVTEIPSGSLVCKTLGGTEGFGFDGLTQKPDCGIAVLWRLERGGNGRSLEGVASQARCAIISTLTGQLGDDEVDALSVERIIRHESAHRQHPIPWAHILELFPKPDCQPVSSPTRVPFSTRQIFGFASQPFSVLPSNMDVKPASLLAGTSGTVVLCDGPPSAACSAAENAIVAQKLTPIANILIVCLLG